MDKEKIAPWIEKLNAEPDGKKRNGIVAEMCKEHGLKIGDAWKLLKEAGFDPKADPPGDQQDKLDEKKFSNNKKDENPAPGAESALSPKEGSGAAEGGADSANEKKQPAVLRHKTEYSRYRCAGLVLTQKPETYQVTEAQLEKLKHDPWVEVS